MRAGLLRHRITIQEPTEVQDASGSPVATWVDNKINIYSTYEPQSGKESLQEDHIQAFITVKFRVRYLSDITPKMRVMFEGVEHDIISVLPFKLRGELHLICKAAS